MNGGAARHRALAYGLIWFLNPGTLNRLVHPLVSVGGGLGG